MIYLFYLYSIFFNNLYFFAFDYDHHLYINFISKLIYSIRIDNRLVVKWPNRSLRTTHTHKKKKLKLKLKVNELWRIKFKSIYNKAEYLDLEYKSIRSIYFGKLLAINGEISILDWKKNWLFKQNSSKYK